MLYLLLVNSSSILINKVFIVFQLSIFCNSTIYSYQIHSWFYELFTKYSAAMYLFLKRAWVLFYISLVYKVFARVNITLNCGSKIFVPILADPICLWLLTVQKNSTARQTSWQRAFKTKTSKIPANFHAMLTRKRHAFIFLQLLVASKFW